MSSLIPASTSEAMHMASCNSLSEKRTDGLSELPQNLSCCFNTVERFELLLKALQAK